MDNGNTTESERWLTTAAKLLASGDFHGARSFTIRARDSAPLLADQILAVTDTLLTAQSNPSDWYGILQLVPLTQSMEALESQYWKLAILLSPGKNTLPFADQAFRLVNEAWNVLSNPSNKLVYDNDLRLLQFGHVNQFNQQQHYHQPQIQQLQPQTQPMFMQPQPPPPPPKETQPLFVRSPRNNNDGNAALEGGEQLGLNNYSAESTGTEEINQTGLTQPSQINRPETIEANQISNQTESNQTELTRSVQINQEAAPAPTTENSRTEPTYATRGYNSTQVSQATQSAGSTFWTACPHCYSRFEYPKVYVDRTLRCQTKDCRRAFRAVVVPSPSVQTELPGVSRNTSSTRASQATESGGATFWTVCPYCYTLHEYLKLYKDCTLRCQTKGCKRAFHAVVVPSPPLNWKDTHLCCWAFFPIGVSGSGNFPSWSPISTMFACPDNKNAGKQNTKKSAPRVFYDEDLYVELSDSSASSEESDDDWRNEMREKKVNNSKGKGSRGRNGKKPQSDRVRKGSNDDVYVELSDSSVSSEEVDDDDWRNEMREKKVNNSKGKGSRGRNGKKPQSDRVKKGSNDQVNVDSGGNLNGVSMVQEDVPTSESSRRGVANSGRKQLKRRTKALGKLDLNVEFRNEVEEPVAGRSMGNHAGNGEEEEDKNEGNGFFEGLDEFFCSLPILSVVGDDKVKATE